MGFGNELREMMEIDRDVMWAVNEENIRSGIWTQRDGTKINIMDMSRQHIRNCISMLERGDSPFAAGWISRFKGELKLREYIEKVMRGEL